MKRLHKLIIPLIVFSTVACDQSTKIVARRVLKDRGTIRVIDEFFILHYVENEGAFLSLGASWPPSLRFLILIVLSLAVVVAVFVYMLKDKHLTTFQIICLSLILGGGVGNLIDRALFRGLVTDFMNLGVGNLRTGIFNFADIFILFGCGLFIITLFRRGKTSVDE